MITKELLVHDLSRFIMETRKKDGTEFPPKMLKHILLMVQMYLSSIGLEYEFLEYVTFKGLSNCLDNKMKQNAKLGLGGKVHKADPLEPPAYRSSLGKGSSWGAQTT